MSTLTLHPAIREAALAVAVPRIAAADSFVLHAPLELMARVGLLPLVRADAHDDALRQITDLAAQYVATGPGVSAPSEIMFGSLEEAAAALDAALREGDAGAADAAMCWIAERADHATVRRLIGEAIVDSLAAAGHAPIGLHLLPSVGGGALSPALLRGAVRTLASRPDWRLDWFREARALRSEPTEDAADASSMDDWAAALAGVPIIGRPGSDFIYPLMSQVQGRGVAAAALAPLIDGPVDVESAGRILLRAAAWSMLHDDPEQAPYGWSHCLTMPQAVLSLAGDGVEARTALAVAGTYVVGFRAAHATTPLGALDDLAGTTIDARGVPDVGDLATFAALHHDAHLVKYTLACIHAAERDPAWAGTFLSAAAHLADWWKRHPAADG